MYYGDIVKPKCTTVVLFNRFKNTFFKSYYQLIEHSFTKGLEHLNIFDHDCLDGKGPMDLYLYNYEEKM